MQDKKFTHSSTLKKHEINHKIELLGFISFFSCHFNIIAKELLAKELLAKELLAELLLCQIAAC